jgi:hypothetical protein
MKKSINKIEFGDFQTPKNLAKEVILTIQRKKSYDSIIEPTCGLGSFLEVFLETGIPESTLEGWEINPSYVKNANKSLYAISGNKREIVQEKDFFSINWLNFKVKVNKSILFIGNPPWVTNSELGKLLSKNLPKKYNFQNFSGLEAMTGKSNFDISEWMLIQLLDFISGTNSSIAFLIKTSVARKLFQYLTKNNLSISNMSIREINAKLHFDVSVDACLFVAEGVDFIPKEYTCPLYEKLESDSPYKIMGVSNNKLVSDIFSYNKLSIFDSKSEFKWRSGVKHDAAKVMELNFESGRIINGFGQIVDIPLDYLYPMYKSSHISKEKILPPIKYMILTQKKIGEETKNISIYSDKTWQYLLKHESKLDSRKSSIYKNNPRFSIFGVGDYTFSPWKIVISGLYKNMIFSKIGSYNKKPIVVDDTCYMLGFHLEEQADFVLKILTSEVCKEFINSLVFIDNKRPITIALLNRIKIKNIALSLGLLHRYDLLFPKKSKQIKLI